MSMIDKTVSYKIVFPTFLLVSVLVATCAKISFIASEASASLCPSMRSRRRIFTYKEKRVTHFKQFKMKMNEKRHLTCKNGSLIPLTSCSGEYPARIKFFNMRTRFGTICEYNSDSILYEMVLIEWEIGSWHLTVLSNKGHYVIK